MSTMAEKAYDLIAEEFKNAQPQNNVDAADVNSGGKRKTISVTEVLETEKNGTLPKKNTEEEHNTDGNKKKHKKSKKNTVHQNETEDILPKLNGCSIHNGIQHEEDIQSQNTNQAIKKKKNKHKKNSVSDPVEDIVQNGNHQNVNITNGTNDTVVVTDDNLSKLTKKERKKLMKQKKYEAEIESIESYKKDNESIEEPVEEQTEKRKKKKKKTVVEESEDCNRQQKNSISEPEDKKIKLEDEEEPAEVEKPRKFKWDEIILQVLRSQSDGEMSLKRLSKKVIGEYANIFGERESYEEVALKFNKKVLRTPGVRVLKDRAKLLTD